MVHALCHLEVNTHKIYVHPVLYTVVISNLRPVKITKTVQIPVPILCMI